MGIHIAGREYAQVKRYVAGTHRTRSPAETLDDYMKYMPRLGITRLANVTGLDRIGLPVYVAIRPNARSLATAQGKGADPLSAKASALMESIEVWHGEHIERPLRYESYARLRELAPVIDITRLPLPMGMQLRPDAPLLWIEGYDLLREQTLYVPYECATMSLVAPPGHIYTFPPSSNGLASGNHLLEAICHGLCEVIERDALTLWELGKAPKQQHLIDPATIRSPICQGALEKLGRAGVMTAIWDITSDLEVPTYAAEIWDDLDRPSWRQLGIFGGYGTHLDPEVALMRAISEAIQSRLAFISGSRDDLFNTKYEVDRAALAAHVADILRAPPERSFGTRANQATPTFEGDLTILLQALRRVGIEHAVVVDLTRPEIGIPVVKVIVPGLEARLGAISYQPGQRARERMKR